MFYKTREKKKKIGVTATTLRKYEKEGIISPHHRSPNGYRYYSDEQITAYFNGEYVKPKKINNTNSTDAVNDS